MPTGDGIKDYFEEMKYAAEHYFRGEPWEIIASGLSEEVKKHIGDPKSCARFESDLDALWRHFGSASAVRRALDAPASAILAKEIGRGYLDESIRLDERLAQTLPVNGDMFPVLLIPPLARLMAAHRFWQRIMGREGVFPKISPFSQAPKPALLFLLTPEEWIRYDICSNIIIRDQFGSGEGIKTFLTFRRALQRKFGGGSGPALPDQIEIWDILGLFRKAIDEVPGSCLKDRWEKELYSVAQDMCYIDPRGYWEWLGPAAARIMDMELSTGGGTPKKTRIFEVFGEVIEPRFTSMAHYNMENLPANLHIMLKTVFSSRMTAPLPGKPQERECLFDLFMTGTERLARWLDKGLPAVVQRSRYNQNNFKEHLSRLRSEGDGLFVSALAGDPELMKMFSEYISRGNAAKRIGILFPGAVTAATMSRSSGSAETEFFEEMSL